MKTKKNKEKGFFIKFADWVSQDVIFLWIFTKLELEKSKNNAKYRVTALLTTFCFVKKYFSENTQFFINFQYG